jgi:hypothetical protein
MREAQSHFFLERAAWFLALQVVYISVVLMCGRKYEPQFKRVYSVVTTYRAKFKLEFLVYQMNAYTASNEDL